MCNQRRLHCRQQRRKSRLHHRRHTAAIPSTLPQANAIINLYQLCVVTKRNRGFMQRDRRPRFVSLRMPNPTFAFTPASNPHLSDRYAFAWISTNTFMHQLRLGSHRAVRYFRFIGPSEFALSRVEGKIARSHPGCESKLQNKSQFSPWATALCNPTTQ